MKTTQEILVSLSDADFTRLLDIQEFDKQTQDDCIAHIVELGISARENSIKATKKRKSQEKLAANIEAFNKFLKLSPETAKDSVQLLKVMQSFGLGVNSIASEISAKANEEAA